MTAGRVRRTIATSRPVASSRSAFQNASGCAFDSVPIIPESR